MKAAHIFLIVFTLQRYLHTCHPVLTPAGEEAIISQVAKLGLSQGHRWCN